MTDDFFDGGAIRADDQHPSEYFDDTLIPPEFAPALSASMAADFFNHSPARALYNSRYKPDEYRRNLVLGTVAHSVILRQDGWETDIAVLPDHDNWRSKAAQVWRDAKIAEGKQPILQKEMDAIWEMRKAWERKKLLSMLTVAGRAEVSIYWRCPETFCVCKVRWDFLPDPKFLNKKYPALDYKTTASLVDWQRKNVMNYNLMLRAALYYESLIALTGHPCNIAYAVQEKDAPYSVQVHHLALHEGGRNEAHAEFIEAGRKQLRAVKEQFAECQRSDKWPERKELVAFDVDVGIIKRQKDKPVAETSAVEFVGRFE